MDICEGKVKKGGVNDFPKHPRPLPPKGQCSKETKADKKSEKATTLAVISCTGKKIVDITLSKPLSYDQIRIIRVRGYTSKYGPQLRCTKFLTANWQKKNKNI